MREELRKQQQDNDNQREQEEAQRQHQANQTATTPPSRYEEIQLAILQALRGLNTNMQTRSPPRNHNRNQFLKHYC